MSRLKREDSMLQLFSELTGEDVNDGREATAPSFVPQTSRLNQGQPEDPTLVGPVHKQIPSLNPSNFKDSYPKKEPLSPLSGFYPRFRKTQNDSETSRKTPIMESTALREPILSPLQNHLQLIQHQIQNQQQDGHQQNTLLFTPYQVQLHGSVDPVARPPLTSVGRDVSNGSMGQLMRYSSTESLLNLLSTNNNNNNNNNPGDNSGGGSGSNPAPRLKRRNSSNMSNFSEISMSSAVSLLKEDETSPSFFKSDTNTNSPIFSTFGFGAAAAAPGGGGGGGGDAPQDMKHSRMASKAKPAVSKASKPEEKTAGSGKDKVSLEFVDRDKFCKTYQRNNKKGGKKHLRCFPYCAKPGHKSIKPCDQELLVDYLRKYRHPVPDNTIIIARFICVTEESVIASKNPISGKQGEVQVGDKIDSKVILANLRDSERPTNPLFQGSLENTAVTEVGGEHFVNGRFKFAERAWQYGWVSGRYRVDMEHALRCYVFESFKGSSDPDELVCAAIATSPPFKIFSSRFRYNEDHRAAAKQGGDNKLEKQMSCVNDTMKRKASDMSTDGATCIKRHASESSDMSM